MAIRWDSESDWKNNQDSSGTTSRNGELKQGYRRDLPPLTNGLVGYWPLHDDSATDYSGNNNHGTLNGGVKTGVAGKGGLQAMSFDGSDDYISLGSLNVGSSVTALAWVNLDQRKSSENHTIGPHVDNGSTQGFRIFTDSDTGEVGVWTRNNNDSVYSVVSSYLPPLNDWVLIAFTYDGSTGTLYADGDVIASENMTANSFAGNSYIGRYSGGGYNLKGNEYGVRLYDRALSQQEIQTLYEWGNGDYAGPPSDGVSYYKMDGDATDSWGSNSTTNSGVLFSSDAVRGQSGEFQASNGDRLVIDNSGDSSHPLNVGNLAASDFSISTWVKFDSFPNANNDIIGSYDGAWYILWYNTDKGFRWGMDDGSNKLTADGGTAQTDTWYHLTGTYDSSEKKAELYVNSSKIAEGVNTSFSATNSSNPVHIGDGGSGRTRPVNGHIDDLRIYERKLRPHEISELYRYGTRGRDMRKFLVTH